MPNPYITITLTLIPNLTLTLSLQLFLTLNLALTAISTLNPTQAIAFNLTNYKPLTLPLNLVLSCINLTLVLIIECNHKFNPNPESNPEFDKTNLNPEPRPETNSTRVSN